LSSSPAGGTWSSSNSGIASVGTTGIVTGVTAGAATISYVLGTGCMRTLTMNVVAGLPAITAGGTWSSSTTTVATVSTTGTVTGVAAGATTISYTLGGCRVTAVVTVTSAPPVITGAIYVCAGSTTTLSDATAGGTWTSSNPSMATIDPSTGLVTGVTAGMLTISYAVSGSCVRTASFTVRAVPAAIVGNAGICTGGTSTLTDPSPTGVSWTSSTPSVATIGSISGTVTGISAGTSTITYLNNSGCSTTRVVTVDAAPSVAAITGPSSVIIGHTIALADATPGGTWTSSNTSNATINSSGVVTGVGGAAVTISYTVASGVCTISATRVITITASRSATIAGAEDNNVLNVYPNPTSGSFAVQTSVAGVFSIYTLEGKEVQQHVVAPGINSLSLPNGLAAGIYMCRFNGEDGSAVMVRLVYE
jgi:uncharacterized protein YjdB